MHECTQEEHRTVPCTVQRAHYTYISTVCLYRCFDCVCFIAIVSSTQSVYTYVQYTCVCCLVYEVHCLTTTTSLHARCSVNERATAPDMSPHELLI